jgi:hypothetical protein
MIFCGETYKMKTVIILGGNTDQLPYLLELKKQKFKIILFDMNENCVGKYLSDQFYCFGYDNATKILEILDNIKIQGELFIFTASSQFANVTLAEIAKKFGIKFPSTEIIKKCLNKSHYYALFEEYNIPIPETKIVKNYEELVSIFSQNQNNLNYYLKSDCGKSPNYIYKVNSLDYKKININWKVDRYFQECYLLQEEFVGFNCRLNLYPGGYNAFSFFDNEICNIKQLKKINELKIIDSLKQFIALNDLGNLLVKFDVIFNDDTWVCLDIGLDPPFRMKNKCEELDLNFVGLYVDHYINGRIEYPNFGV